ncbi:MAG: hypothetical protein MR690_04610, partial [Rikenellaceae bacterium]|nr:hypothetical protein [Rikenellaceae bacterium]
MTASQALHSLNFFSIPNKAKYLTRLLRYAPWQNPHNRKVAAVLTASQALHSLNFFSIPNKAKYLTRLLRYDFYGAIAALRSMTKTKPHNRKVAAVLFFSQALHSLVYCHRKLHSFATEKWELDYFRANDY